VKNNKVIKLYLLTLFFTLSSCYNGRLDPLDRNIGLTKSDFQDLIIKKSVERKNDEKKPNKTSTIPTTSNLLKILPPAGAVGDRLISISVTDQVPLKDVLIELGRVAKVDTDIDSLISGGIIFSVRNRPLKEVLDRISALGSLRYTYSDDILHFERDSPFLKNYIVDYLPEGSNLWADVSSNISAILKGESSDSEDKKESSISVNKSAGIISAFATTKQHEIIANYLSEVHKYSSAQVLIEAKVVEVTLKDLYKTGIDWTWTGLHGGTTVSSYNGFKGSVPASGSGTTAVVAVGGASVGGTTSTGVSGLKQFLFGGNLNMAISALEEFGTTRTLSSPRIHAINNQKATLNFTKKLVYFKVEIVSSASGANTATAASGTGGGTAVVVPNNIITTTTTSTKLEENEGVEITIVPSINLKTNEVMLTVKPKISLKVDEAEDPANSLNVIPVMATRELNTVAKIKSGNILIIGGLMKESTKNTDNGIPFLKDIPILGYFFKSSIKDSEITETVVFIKATIIGSDSKIDKEDREFLDKMNSSKRKF
jgi:general secretion pathway protein D